MCPLFKNREMSNGLLDGHPQSMTWVIYDGFPQIAIQWDWLKLAATIG